MGRIERYIERLSKNTIKTLNVGQSNFRQDIFSTEVMTPHAIMDKSIDYYETDPNIGAGVDIMSLFIKPDEILIKSEDKVTAEWWRVWLEMRPNFDNDVDKFILIATASGNAYFRQKFNGGKLSNVITLDDPTRVYYNLKDDVIRDESKFWIYSLPRQAQTYRGVKAGEKQISYIDGDNFVRKTVYGIYLPKSELLHFKLGWSRDTYYGKCLFNSGLDTLDVVREIIKSYALRARYKTLGKNVWSLGSDQRPAGPDDVDNFQLQTEMLDDESDIVINKEVNKTEITQTGSDPMSAELDYSRKSSTASLVPNHITPFAEDVNRSTSEEAKIPFELKLNVLKRRFIKFMNDNIIKPIQKATPHLKDAEFDFGVVDLSNKTDRTNMAISLYELNALTYNELREAFGLDSLPGGNVFAKDIESPGEDLTKLLQRPQQRARPNPKTELDIEDKKRVKEISDTFKKTINQVKEELPNWKHFMNEEDGILKSEKRIKDKHYQLFVMERDDGMYVVQLFRGQEKIDRKIVSLIDVVDTVDVIVNSNIFRKERYKFSKEVKKK